MDSLQLYTVSGRALIFFLDDEIDFYEDAAIRLCQTISQIYQCQSWHCYLWDAIIVDIDNIHIKEPVFTMQHQLIELPMPSEHIRKLSQKINAWIVQNLPTTVVRNGYFQYAYSQFA
jgi:hypothetical protein